MFSFPRAAEVHLNFRAGSTFPVPVCTVSPTQQGWRGQTLGWIYFYWRVKIKFKSTKRPFHMSKDCWIMDRTVQWFIFFIFLFNYKARDNTNKKITIYYVVWTRLTRVGCVNWLARYKRMRVIIIVFTSPRRGGGLSLHNRPPLVYVYVSKKLPCRKEYFQSFNSNCTKSNKKKNLI